MSTIYLYFALGNADMILTFEYDGHILASPVASAIRTANPGRYLMPPGAGRVAEIVASWHQGWEEMETERGIVRENVTNKG